MKKNFLIFAFFAIIPIALAYGVSPDWFASKFLGIEMLDKNIAHILRAVMCLYLALSIFWLYSAFNEAYRNPALLTIIFNQLFRRWSASTDSNPVYWIRVCPCAHGLLGIQTARMIGKVAAPKKIQRTRHQTLAT